MDEKKSKQNKSHLDYDSVNAWIVGEEIPSPINSIKDAREKVRRYEEYGELRQHLFKKHISSLSHDLQNQFKNGRHPSQSHKFADRAQQYADAFRIEMKQLGYECEVSLGWYQLDRIVLSCTLDQSPDRVRDLPWIFQGFEIKYFWPK